MDADLIVLSSNSISSCQTADESEQVMLKKAEGLLTLNYPDHALLEIWNCSIHNLRRRVEAYSVEMFCANISSLSGRKTYKNDGDSLSERWAGIDDEVLISGAAQIGVLSKKAGKALEMINWMRNHASPAHDTTESVSKEDVLGLVVILKTNLWDCPLPDPAHSPVSLINPIKSVALTDSQVSIFREQIDSFSNKDNRTVFGFALDLIAAGKEPGYSNVLKLFDIIWENALEEQKSDMGMRIYNYNFDPSQDKSDDKGAAERLYDAILNVKGIKYIPEIARAAIYRKLAKSLARAKNTSYGWSLENSASEALKQVGVHVPDNTFEEVYQEILCVWCGNYWGRSDAHEILSDFIFTLSAKQKVKIAKLFTVNKRVQSELSQIRPNNYAVDLLTEIRNGLTNESQKAEIDEITTFVKKLK